MAYSLVFSTLGNYFFICSNKYGYFSYKSSIFIPKLYYRRYRKTLCLLGLKLLGLKSILSKKWVIYKF